MTTINPYAAPKAAVADETVVLDADFVPGGQSRPAGHGWMWVTEGWELFKRQPGLWIGITLLLFVIFLATAFIPLVGGVLSALFWPVFGAGIAIGCRALDEGGELELGHLFAGFRENLGTLVGVGAISFAATLGVMLVVFAIMGVGMFGMMGGDPQALTAMGLSMVLAMLIVAALLLPVMMAIWFAPPLVVFNRLGAWEALKMSFTGCLKNIIPFLIYGVVLLVLGLLALLPLGLGWLILWPVLAASVYTAYRDIYLKPRQ